MIIKTFGIDFISKGGALTLRPEEVTEIDYFIGKSTRIHNDGWTITGVVTEDYFYWVNEFEASHSEFGEVWGDFEDKVYSDSEEGFNHFYKQHTPEAWDYGDI